MHRPYRYGIQDKPPAPIVAFRSLPHRQTKMMLLISLLFSLLPALAHGATLVAPGRKAVLVSEVSDGFEGRGVKSGTGGNAYFTSTTYLDPCDGYEGVKFPYTTLPAYGSKILGFYVVSDCQVVLCGQSRSSHAATACADDGCVSQTTSSTDGSTKIYDLVPSKGDNAEFVGAQTGNVCTCASTNVGYQFIQQDGHQTCYVSKTVVSVSSQFYANCLRDDLGGLGKRTNAGGCGTGVSRGGKAAAISISLLLVVLVLAVVLFRFYYRKNHVATNTTDSKKSMDKVVMEEEEETSVTGDETNRKASEDLELANEK
jgi:hypothetical protein